MIGTVNAERSSRALEFGMYRDGDNNLDEVQAATIGQALQTSHADHSIEFTIEDTTARRGFEPKHVLRTESYEIADGKLSRSVDVSAPHDMSDRRDLTEFVAHVLDNAERSNATQTWIDLIDHGGGDGGGMQSEHSDAGIMREDDIAGAIADGVALHAQEHPEDAGRKVDGVVANQCLMATVAFSSALSRAGVNYLAASPETMLAPGVPSGVAHDIAANVHDPQAMAKNVVDTTMNETYGSHFDGFAPAAAFDVIDLDPGKTAAVASAVKNLDAELVKAAADPEMRAAIREDAVESRPACDRALQEALRRRTFEIGRSRSCAPRAQCDRGHGDGSRGKQRLRTVQRRGLLERVRPDGPFPGIAQTGRHVGAADLRDRQRVLQSRRGGRPCESDRLASPPRHSERRSGLMRSAARLAVP
jgi:hypothetical protein